MRKVRPTWIPADEEDIYVGYRYFDTFQKKVKYPFGYGLSYSEFDIKTEKICYDGEFLNLRVVVENIGGKSGKEVIQIYVGKPETEEETPRKELVAFEKTEKLKSGEKQVIEIKIPKKHLGIYSSKRSAYILQKGIYKVFVGNCVEASKCGEIGVEKEEILKM